MRIHHFSEGFEPRSWAPPFRNLRDAALLATLAYCGVRPAEVLVLRWSDLNLKARVLRVTGRNSNSVRRGARVRRRGLDVGQGTVATLGGPGLRTSARHEFASRHESR